LSWYKAPPIVERDLAMLPRCYECKSADPMGGAPMYHPVHPWGACQVVEAGEACSHTEPTRTQFVG
jgi:hypothetical protein